MSAVISECTRYRYRLSRQLVGAGVVAFVMLNPSTADAETDDATIRRCIGYARAWGFGLLEVVNLFAWRATNPAELLAATDPIGPDNDEHIIAVTRNADLVIAAWGAGGVLHDRDRNVSCLLGHFGVALNALVKTRNGMPGHPLRLRKDAKPFLIAEKP